MLVVNPEQRYTANDALNHPFFQQYVVEEVRHFSPYRKFKVRLFKSSKPHTNISDCFNKISLMHAKCDLTDNGDRFGIIWTL